MCQQAMNPCGRASLLCQWQVGSSFASVMYGQQDLGRSAWALEPYLVADTTSPSMWLAVATAVTGLSVYY